MKNSFIKIQNSLTKLLFVVLVVVVGFAVSALAQVEKPVQVKLDKVSPSIDEVLTALNGGGLTLSNAKIVFGDNEQMAIFSGGLNAGLGMDKGVLFATGQAEWHLTRRNTTDRFDSYTKYDSYDDKDLIGIYELANRDVIIYSFDVTLASHTSALRVAFQFGSEEYPTYVGTRFNDAFGFFVTGPGIVGTENIAKLPTNGNVISVNSVNGGAYGADTYGKSLAKTDLKQTSQYINNGHDTILNPNGLQGNWDNNGPKPVFIEYNGLTKLITYDLTGLQGGQTYQFKIAIADSQDAAYDSGVIIQKIQGTTGADVKIEKTIDKAEVEPGDIVEFTLTTTNLGPYDGKGVKVTDLLPSGYTFISATPSKGTFNAGTGVWSIGNLQAIHQTETLKIIAKVNASGDYTNKATITSDDPDPDPDNNVSEVTPKVNTGLSGFDCFNDIVGNGFEWGYNNGKPGSNPPSNPVVKQIDQPASDGGFVLDIYQLDNSFNMIVNNKSLYKEEIEFQTGSGAVNIRFKKDGALFGSGNGISDIWGINDKNDNNENIIIDLTDRTKNPTPAIRVVIDKEGIASLYGKRNSKAQLEELEMFNTNTKVAEPLKKVDWHKVGTGNTVNNIKVTQNVIGQTLMSGFGYGQQIKACETCTVEKDGISKAVNPNSVKVGEVITYTFNVKNLGDMEIHDVTIDDPLFGFDIKVDAKDKKVIPSNVTMTGDANGNFILDKTEMWTFTVDYKVTADDIYKTKGVYNRATVNGTGISNISKMPVTKESIDPTPYKAGDIGWDPIREYHTYVPLKGQSLFISNPHIYQKVK
ncbi:DUF11 domain-containing protein [Myroides sp. M-43]|uniref:choice-of-anchor L domain-containing protein n=1 Tax=Myroides oncorhynchi TaxID=2893756 RepID=UPI001E469527|nr:choice-of-anchor L domain-containing protein [Myroides oncorhynchi]MCC9041293.1 DUF11 domain-containing protein [Myroides oncorhynchi]